MSPWSVHEAQRLVWRILLRVFPHISLQLVAQVLQGAENGLAVYKNDLSSGLLSCVLVDERDRSVLVDERDGSQRPASAVSLPL